MNKDKVLGLPERNRTKMRPSTAPLQIRNVRVAPAIKYEEMSRHDELHTAHRFHHVRIGEINISLYTTAVKTNKYRIQAVQRKSELGELNSWENTPQNLYITSK